MKPSIRFGIIAGSVTDSSTFSTTEIVNLADATVELCWAVQTYVPLSLGRRFSMAMVGFCCRNVELSSLVHE